MRAGGCDAVRVVLGTELQEMDDRWLLGWRGLKVEQIRVDYRLVFLLGQDTELAVEQPASISLGPVTAPGCQPRQVVPESGDIEAALALLHSTVLSAVAFKSGALRVVFDTGHHLNVRQRTDFEAWTSKGPGSALAVSTPGGGLSVWR